MSETLIGKYFDSLFNLGKNTACSSSSDPIGLTQAIDWCKDRARKTHAQGNKLMFIGNGGSAGISSHLAIDYSKNGNMRALAFNDGAALTCLANDLGYENVFAKQIELHARKGDLLFAISSSGRSPNIIEALKQAKNSGCAVITMSGFTPDNPLREMGDINLYVDSNVYGLVEILHLTLGHLVLDIAMESF